MIQFKKMLKGLTETKSVKHLNKHGENDAIQLENPDEDLGANQTSLNKYRQYYILKTKQNKGKD